MSCLGRAQNIPEEKLKSVAASKEWSRLLHYKKNLWGQFRSQLDGSGFFFSPQGDSDLLAELKASIQGLQANQMTGGKLKQPAVCAFPERARFISEQLKISFPKMECEQYKIFLEQFHGPQGVSLVFSSAYPNNPASMFGHTFLKVNSLRGTDLLDTGINFAAYVSEDENPFAFLFLGVAGGYVGQWSTQPYYVKVAEYINFESRDLWEYQLNLSPEETQRLIAHLWELETNSYFDYYFFDENCSYQVLAAIEAIRPDWTFLDQYKIYLIPGESVKYTVFEPGVLKEVKYRPSLYKKMWQKFEVLDTAERTEFQAVMKNKKSPAEVTSRPVLDALISYLDYLRGEDKDAFAKDLAPLRKEVLSQRATLGQLTPEEEKRYPALTGSTRPDLGHDSYSVEMGLGTRKFDSASSSQSFAKLKIKSAYHDLLNKDLGYTPYAHIDFPAIEFQINDQDRRFRVESITAIATTSLTPVSPLRTPISFRVDTGLTTTREFANCEECTEVFGEVGGGLTYQVPSTPIHLYGLLLARVDLGGHLMKGYGYGPGLELGALSTVGDDYKMYLKVRSLCDLNYFDDCRKSDSFSFSQSLSLGRNHELRNVNQWVQPDSRTGPHYFELGLTYILFFN
ncbi:hypothetical protein D3C87_162270 [compost metagenome]